MTIYYYKDQEGNLRGPLTAAHILDLRDAGQLSDETPICQAETETWSPLGELHLERPVESTAQHPVWLVLGALCVVGVFAYLFHAFNGESSTPVAPAGATTKALPSNQRPPMLSLQESHQLYDAQRGAMRADPDLDAEYKAAVSSMQDEQDKIEEAMIEIDPNVAIIIDKRTHRHQIIPFTAGNWVSVSNQISGIQDDMKELHDTYKAAMKAKPGLDAECRKMVKSMRKLTDKLNAAAVQIDPTIAPVVAKYNATREYVEMREDSASDASPSAP